MALCHRTGGAVVLEQINSRLQHLLLVTFLCPLVQLHDEFLG